MKDRAKASIAFSSSAMLLLASAGLFLWLYRSVELYAGRCLDGFAVTSSEWACRAPVIANYSFLVCLGVSLLIFSLGVRYRRNYRSEMAAKTRQESDAEVDEIQNDGNVNNP